MDYSLPGSSAHGICQARELEWGAFAVSSWFTVDTEKPAALILLEKNEMSGDIAKFLPQ